ncbi:MAG: hypothetical protein MZU79_02370 [Anaerotruncus sp.]|nr:hypothetical protein [Anaerotruncus sp.]
MVFACGHAARRGRSRAEAVEEGLPLFAAADSTFEIAGQLYALGVRGASDARETCVIRVRRPARAHRRSRRAPTRDMTPPAIVRAAASPGARHDRASATTTAPRNVAPPSLEAAGGAPLP